MKKLTILVLALLLLIPISSSAYTTFIALDSSVVADGLTGLTFDLISPGAIFTTSGGGSGPFTFFGGSSGGSINTAVNTTFQDLPYLTTGISLAVFPPSTSFDEAGVLLYYQNATMAVPNFVQAIAGVTDVTANYVLSQTFDFADYTGGFTAPDAGDFYTLSQVPLPSAVFLLAPGLLALFGLRRKLS